MLLLLLALQSGGGDPSVYHGRRGDLTVPIPRSEATVEIDGALDEPVWLKAAVLTGFSQYMPIDGRPAEDSTDVYVWYSARGIYFGVRAFEAHGVTNATLADRDNIDTDDYVQILLDTFNDRRRAFVFGVNPLGVQTDGVRSEGTFGAAGGPGAGGRFENVDLNPDFVFQSKGRVTPLGFEVEVFIPFRSIRYQSADPQHWAVNVIRKVQHSGYEDTWTPARRASASFLAQSGTLTGLTGLRRGLVLDVNPFATGKALGKAEPTGWSYETTPEIGVTGRWGVTANLSLDATINPDFSQVEADVGQVTVNERFAVFFPEKRPFFLEGIELFDTPNQLIYMRRVRNPIGGVKVAGKVSGTSVGVLSAVDDHNASSSGDDNPIVNLVRVRRDLGEHSTLGFAYTDRIDGPDHNRVAAADARVVFGELYFFEVQGAMGFTRTGDASRSGPLWQLLVDRTGRSWGFNYRLKGLHPDFETASGFVPRTGTVEPFIANRLTAYGEPGATLENWTGFFVFSGVWDYHEFFEAASPLETTLRVTNLFTLRGGWSLSVTPSWETVAFDPAFYDGYAVEHLAGAALDTLPFQVPDRVNGGYTIGASVQTPEFPTFSASAGGQIGKRVSFFEPARANALSLNASLNWRPTGQARIELRYVHERLNRERDGTRLSTANIPRLKIEYQIARPLFVRFVGQYNAQRRDALRDPRTDNPILTREDSVGDFVRSSPLTANDLRVDWLISYRPSPGTVVFAGYGASLSEDRAFTFGDLQRVDDGIFVKLSYLFRVR